MAKIIDFVTRRPVEAVRDPDPPRQASQWEVMPWQDWMGAFMEAFGPNIRSIAVVAIQKDGDAAIGYSPECLETCIPTLGAITELQMRFREATLGKE